MSGVLTCRVTATASIGGTTPVTLVVDVPDNGTGLVDVTLNFPPPVGSVPLVGIPCPTLAPLTITVGPATITISVQEVRVP